MQRPWRLQAWGNGSSGQLGINATPEECVAPTQVLGLPSPPLAMAAGGSHTLFLAEDRTLLTWGSGAEGRAANATKPQPLHLSTELPLVSLAAGWSHSLAIDANGHLHAWGSNSHRQLGLPSAAAQPSLPMRVSLPGPATHVACGMRHSLAVLADGTLHAWGESKFAQLGNALTEPCASPQLVRGLPREPLVSISAGARHSACVSRTGCVFTFGNNRHGQLGVDPALTAASATPVHVKELDGLGVKQVQCGWHHCIAMTESGQVWGFGRNLYGQLGSADAGSTFTPRRIHFDGKAIAIACGSEHTLILLEDGQLLVCGWNEHGQLGVGDTKDRAAPVRVPGHCTFLASGYGHSFGVFTEQS